MHSYSSAHRNMVGQCPCGLFHPHNQCSSSSLWPPASSTDHFYSPSPSVDCTLSLGTPSTRRSSSSTDPTIPSRSSAARLSNFCWDFLQPKHFSSTPKSTSQLYRSPNNNIHTPTTTTTITTNYCSSRGSDSLLARRCANCDTTSTPLWRNGPKGPKSLCNACGIRFKKEERRATAATATSGGILESHVVAGYNNSTSNGSSSWAHSSAQKVNHYLSAPAMGKDFRFIDHDVDAAHFLSWHLNVTDRPTPLVHDFNR